MSSSPGCDRLWPHAAHRRYQRPHRGHPSHNDEAVWDAHVAAVAVAAKCPILTLDAAKWQRASAAFDPQLQVIEISDPGD